MIIEIQKFTSFLRYYFGMARTLSRPPGHQSPSNDSSITVLGLCSSAAYQNIDQVTMCETCIRITH